MNVPETEVKILDCKASENEYLHRDFHGALCYSIKYLDETYGREATAAYLRRVGKTCFAPLSERLARDGLPALERHFKKIFGMEGGGFSLAYKDSSLVLTVTKCPAIAHLKEKDWFFTERFCMTTVTVNETVCRAAGYDCSCEYEPGAGRCVQKFWKAKEPAT